MLQSICADTLLLHQSVYRILLRAMSRPAEVCVLPAGCGPDTRSRLKAIVETLLDQEVSFAGVGPPDPAQMSGDIHRWTHARPALPSEADFLIVAGSDSHGQVSKLKRGTAEMPDRGATLIYFLTQPVGSSSSDGVFVSGPGIPPPGKKDFPSLGLSAGEFGAIRQANQEFPMGIDCLFIGSDGTVAGLPRSAVISERTPWLT